MVWIQANAPAILYVVRTWERYFVEMHTFHIDVGVLLRANSPARNAVVRFVDKFVDGKRRGGFKSLQRER